MKKLEGSSYIVIGKLSIFSHNINVLIYLSSMLSHVTPLIVGKFKRALETQVNPFEVSTSIRDSIIAQGVYHNCIVTIYDFDTLVVLIELDMIDFNVIMDMNWFATCYCIIDYQTKKIHFHFPIETVHE